MHKNPLDKTYSLTATKYNQNNMDNTFKKIDSAEMETKGQCIHQIYSLKDNGIRKGGN